MKAKLEEKNLQTIGDKLDDHADQMYTYLGSYTKGNLHARVLTGKGSGAFEIYRGLVHKGKNINMHKIIGLNVHRAPQEGHQGREFGQSADRVEVRAATGD